MANFSSLDFSPVKLETVWNGTLYRENKGTVHRDPCYCTVFTSTNEQETSQHRSIMPSFILATKKNLWWKHVPCCAENGSWTSIWHSWKAKDGSENFTWVASFLHGFGAQSRAPLHLCFLETMVAKRCCDACRKQQIRITSQGNY